VTPYYADDWLTILAGDCRTVMAAMEPESVQCVVTSPPYFGLRDYGIEPSVWGGDAHEHEWGESIVANAAGYEVGEKARWNHRQNGRGEVQDRILEKDAVDVGWTRKDVKQGQFCSCGAWLGVLGLEPTVELHVAHMVEVFRGVRRVLRKDGTVWLNIGDSYAASPGQRKSTDAAGPKQLTKRGSTEMGSHSEPGLKPKDRMMVPARVALALQADGWWLRDEIVWSKPNPMPSSVTDRTTPAHEMVYLLTRSARYFYDAEAIREPGTTERPELLTFGDERPDVGYPGPTPNRRRYKMPDGWDTGEGGHGTVHRNGREKGAPPLKQAQIAANSNPATERTMGGFNDRWDASEADAPLLTRNKRSVWTIPTAPYPEAHFATFPPKLVEPCILAGTSARGACPECGAPWERESARDGTGPEFAPLANMGGRYQAWLDTHPKEIAESGALPDGPGTHRKTTGWHPTCKHRPPHRLGCHASGLPLDGPQDYPVCGCGQDADVGDQSVTMRTPDPVPCVVLDPFGGSGTVGMVAQMHSRRACLIDLNPDYLAQCLKRNAQSPLGLES
jgi:DNA modification methylase